MSAPTRRTHWENGSGNIEYNAYNTEDFLNSNEIPRPKYIGSIGDHCENKSQCHANLYCYSNLCSHWSPIDIPYDNKEIIIQRSPNADVRLCTYAEDCPGGWVCINQTCQLPANVQSQKEGFLMRSGQQKQSAYMSKRKGNSGKNYYLYDQTR